MQTVIQSAAALLKWASILSKNSEKSLGTRCSPIGATLACESGYPPEYLEGLPGMDAERLFQVTDFRSLGNG